MWICKLFSWQSLCISNTWSKDFTEFCQNFTNNLLLVWPCSTYSINPTSPQKLWRPPRPFLSHFQCSLGGHSRATNSRSKGSSGVPHPRAEQSTLTVEHGAAVLGGGCQGFAGAVELVAVVADADLELDGLARVLQHRGRVKHSSQAELPSALVFLPKQPSQLDFKMGSTIIEKQ